jgi:predicted GTPase
LTSEGVNEPEPIVGQGRALDAIQFGTRVSGDGFNIIALGTTGTGKYSVVNKILQSKSRKRTVSSDWCYIYNFEYAHKF